MSFGHCALRSVACKIPSAIHTSVSSRRFSPAHCAISDRLDNSALRARHRIDSGVQCRRIGHVQEPSEKLREVALGRNRSSRIVTC